MDNKSNTKKIKGNFLALNREVWQNKPFSTRVVKTSVTIGTICKAMLCDWMLKARFADEPKKVVIGDELVTVGQGQLLLKLANELDAYGLSRHLFYKCLRHLNTIGEIEFETTCKSRETYLLLTCKLYATNSLGNPLESLENKEVVNVSLKHRSRIVNGSLKDRSHIVNGSLKCKAIKSNEVQDLQAPKKERKKEGKKEECKNEKGLEKSVFKKEADIIQVSDSIDPANAVSPRSSEPLQAKPGSIVFSAYSDAYFKRYGVRPPTSAQGFSIAKQIAERVGLEAATKLVSFYLTHFNRFYVEKCHQLRYCLSDAEKLYTEMEKGMRMTTQTAKTIDRGQEIDEQFKRVLAKMQNGQS